MSAPPKPWERASASSIPNHPPAEAAPATTTTTSFSSSNLNQPPALPPRPDLTASQYGSSYSSYSPLMGRYGGMGYGMGGYGMGGYGGYGSYGGEYG